MGLLATTMNKHLKCKHLIETDQALKPKQLDSYTPRKMCSKEWSNYINRLVIKMIVRDLHSLNIVNSKGFKVFLMYFKPEYQLLSDQYFMSLIKQEYADLMEKC